MIPDSQPTSSRSRRTVVFAFSLFLFAALLTVVARLSGNDSVPSDSSEQAIAAPAHFAVPDSTVTATTIGSPDAPITRIKQSRVDGAAKPPRSSTGPILVLVILFAGGGYAMWLKRRKAGVATPNQIESLAKLTLPNSQEVRLIRVKGQELLIGSSQSNVTVLHHFEQNPAAKEIATANLATNVETARSSKKTSTAERFDEALSAAISTSVSPDSPATAVTIHV